MVVTQSCEEKKSSSQKEEVEQVKKETVSESVNKKVLEEPLVEQVKESITDKYLKLYNSKDTLFLQLISELDSMYGETPYFGRLNERQFFVVRTGQFSYQVRYFNGNYKYGIADGDKKLLLDTLYDKIFNPGMVLNDCFEIALNNKVGIFNMATGEVLKPQFDYILPDSVANSKYAYGLKDGDFFQINKNDLSKTKIVEIDLHQYLNKLSFDIHDFKGEKLLNTYNHLDENGPEIGKGVVIPSSFYASLHLFNREYYDDVILVEQDNESIDFGTESAALETNTDGSLSDKLWNYIVEVYESGIDARGYATQSEELIILNKEKQQTSSLTVVEGNSYDYGYCVESGYNLLGDTLVEKFVPINYDNKHYKYSHGSLKQYFEISEDGSITRLRSNRTYDFTKFVKIDESYFEGCYGWPISKEYKPMEENIWVIDHLTIEDLDIMRNEIFADYGYIFQSEQWANYFSRKRWYKPRFQDVSDQLTEVDKHNVQVILKAKDRLLQNEQKIVNQRKTSYYPPG